MACELGFLQGGRTLKSWALHPMAVDNWVVRKAGGREGSRTQGPHRHTHALYHSFQSHRHREPAPPPGPTPPQLLPFQANLGITLKQECPIEDSEHGISGQECPIEAKATWEPQSAAHLQEELDQVQVIGLLPTIQLQQAVDG